MPKKRRDMTPFHASQTADRQHHHISHIRRLMLPHRDGGKLQAARGNQFIPRGEAHPMLSAEQNANATQQIQSAGTGVYLPAPTGQLPGPPADNADYPPTGKHVLPMYLIRHIAIASDLGSRGRYPSARPSISSHRNRISSHLGGNLEEGPVDDNSCVG